MNLGSLYGLNELTGNAAVSEKDDASVSRAMPDNAQTQKIQNFESELKSAYNALAPDQQDEVDQKVEQVRDFVRDQIRRDVQDVTRAHLQQMS